MSESPAPFTELLAPAGSLEAFFAALEAGADAVYCGLKSFSARAKAKNFSFADLDAMTRCAHKQDRKLFVTLNTLVKQQELAELVDTLDAISAAGVDAVILQDLAVWRLARRYFPDLPLHASTQMTVHNSAGVKQLEAMGFERAVLARELTLAEIAQIRSQTSLQLEHFIHGALCFCFSGQCYFSSWLGGQSGNRGRCTQPCRRRYSYRNKPGYYFSPNDLSAIDLLPQLQQAGVCSFKIEGRMKSAEYVANVVAAYRQVLDAPPARRQQAIAEAREKLRDSFGRAPTKGFLSGAQPVDLATPARRGSTGRFLGEVSRAGGGKLSYHSKDVLRIGDRLRVQPRNDQVGKAFTVRELWQGNRLVKQLPIGPQTVSTPFRDAFKPGDAVFKVSSQQAFSLSDAACRRRLQQAPLQRWPLDLRIALTAGQLQLQAELPDLHVESSFAVETFNATDQPLSAAMLQPLFAQTDQAPFALRQLWADNLPPVAIAPKQLKQIRRDFYQQLQQQLEQQQHEQRQQRRRQALDDGVAAAAAGAGGCDFTVMVRDAREIRLLENRAIDRVLVPLTAAVLHRPWQPSPRQQQRLVWDLPFVCFDSDWDRLQKSVHHLVSAGFRAFRLNNLSHFRLFRQYDGLRLEAGYRLFSLNRQAVQAWQELGASSAELYVEDDQANMAALLRHSALPLRALVYSSIDLITSRIRIAGVRGDAPLLSDRDEGYRVRQRAGLTVLSSETDFSLAGQLAGLRQLGCAGFIADLSHLGAFSDTGRRVLDALAQDRALPGTAPFNYQAGME